MILRGRVHRFVHLFPSQKSDNLLGENQTQFSFVMHENFLVKSFHVRRKAVYMSHYLMQRSMIVSVKPCSGKTTYVRIVVDKSSVGVGSEDLADLAH